MHLNRWAQYSPSTTDVNANCVMLDKSSWPMDLKNVDCNQVMYQERHWQYNWESPDAMCEKGMRHLYLYSWVIQSCHAALCIARCQRVLGATRLSLRHMRERCQAGRGGEHVLPALRPELSARL